MTTITKVKAHPISVPLKQPLWTAHEPLKAASLILVEVEASGGLAGYGQISSGPMGDGLSAPSGPTILGHRAPA